VGVREDVGWRKQRVALVQGGGRDGREWWHWAKPARGMLAWRQDQQALGSHGGYTAASEAQGTPLATRAWWGVGLGPKAMTRSWPSLVISAPALAWPERAMRK
jgi:hypothetical protein